MEDTMDVQELIKSKDRIENYLVQNFEFDSPFIASFFNFDKCSQDMHQVIDFLLNKVNFIYGSDLSKDNPFELLAWFVTGERTLGFPDLSDADFEEINRIIELSDNPIIKGRLLDICGIKEKSKEKNYWQLKNILIMSRGRSFKVEIIVFIVHLQELLICIARMISVNSGKQWIYLFLALNIKTTIKKWFFSTILQKFFKI